MALHAWRARRRKGAAPRYVLKLASPLWLREYTPEAVRERLRSCCAAAEEEEEAEGGGGGQEGEGASAGAGGARSPLSSLSWLRKVKVKQGYKSGFTAASRSPAFPASRATMPPGMLVS